MSSIGANLFRLLRGSIVGQGLLYVSMPILARLYGPEDFGVAQAALSMASLLLIAGSLRLEVAVLSSSDAALGDLFRCAWWLCVLTCGAVWIVVVPIAFLMGEWSPAQRSVLLLVPPIGVLACWNQLLTYAALRRQEFNASATAKVVQPVGYAAGALLIGQAHPSSVSLMLADAFGRASTALLLARALHMTRLDLAWPTFGVLRSVLRQNRELATVGLLAAIINAAGSAFTAALLLGLFGAAEAGQYSMVERLVGMPIGLLAGTLSQVFMANLSDSISRSDGNSAVKTFGRVLGMQILTGLPAAIALFVLVPWVLAQVLGPGWETAGEFARALIPVYLCAYIVGPLNMTLTVIGRQRLQLSWDCFRLLLTGGAWAFIWWSGLKSISALQAYAAASCLAYLSYVFLARRALRTWSGGTLKAS